MCIYPLTSWTQITRHVIKLRLKSQGYEDHLTQSVTTVAADEVFRWTKIDAQLCIVIKSTINSSLKQMFRSYETCSDVWAQAKLLYTNDTQRLYGVCQDLGSFHGCCSAESWTHG